MVWFRFDIKHDNIQGQTNKPSFQSTSHDYLGYESMGASLVSTLEMVLNYKFLATRTDKLIGNICKNVNQSENGTKYNLNHLFISDSGT